MKQRVAILHDIRSAHNVGSILRSLACFGDYRVFCTGYTPYPRLGTDLRLPHVASRADQQIAKTALRAERLLHIEHADDVTKLVTSLKKDGYTITACEQADGSVPLHQWRPSDLQVVIFGNEPLGLDAGTLEIVDEVIEITMTGTKESLNVAVAAALVAYQISSCELSTGS